MKSNQMQIVTKQTFLILTYGIQAVFTTTSLNTTSTMSDVITTTQANQILTASTASAATQHQDFYFATIGTTPAAPASIVPDVVLALCVIAGCALLGLGIAKLADWLYDRRMATKDDISNASTYTKNLLRARLAVMKMKKEPATQEQKSIKRVASAWVNAASSKRREQADAEANQADPSNENKLTTPKIAIATIVVDEAPLSDNESVFEDTAQTSFINETQTVLNQRPPETPMETDKQEHLPPTGVTSPPRRPRSPIENKVTPAARLPPINHPSKDTLKRSKSVNQPK